MRKPHISRRAFIGTTSLVAAAATLPAMMRSGDAHAQAMIASAEFAPRFGANASSLVLDGSRLDRLNLLSAKLSAMQGEVLLRLDGTDEYLLDIAAADAGLAVRRGAQISDGTRALITPINRKIA